MKGLSPSDAGRFARGFVRGALHAVIPALAFVIVFELLLDVWRLLR